MKEYTTILVSLLITCLLGVLIGFLICSQRVKRASNPTPIIKSDTTFIHDTITKDKPVYLSRNVIEKVYIPVVDTVSLRDTVFLVMEREQIRWEDSLSVVYASGILPDIDSVTHFINERVITIEKTIPVKVKTRWGVGISAGYGANRDGLSPFIGVGVSYNFLSW